MKKRYTLTAAALVALSLAGNAHWGYHEWQARTMEDACARSLDVYACHWQLTPTPLQEEQATAPAEASPEGPTSSLDPIGDMIRNAEAHGLPVPPRAGRS